MKIISQKYAEKLVNNDDRFIFVNLDNKDYLFIKIINIFSDDNNLDDYKIFAEIAK